jgi:hypothetical protein
VATMAAIRRIETGIMNFRCFFMGPTRSRIA